MTSARIFLGHALAKSDRRGEARAILNELKSEEAYVSPTELAALYVALGDMEGAVATLESAYAEHDVQLQYLKVVPHFDSLRGDPRVQQLMERVGLP